MKNYWFCCYSEEFALHKKWFYSNSFWNFLVFKKYIQTVQKMKFSINYFFSKCDPSYRSYDLWQSLHWTSRCLYLTWKKKNIYRRRHTCSDWQCIRYMEQFRFNLWNSVFTKSTKANTAQKMKFSIKNFFSKCDQIRSFLNVMWDVISRLVCGSSCWCKSWEAQIELQVVYVKVSTEWQLQLQFQFSDSEWVRLSFQLSMREYCGINVR